jgi:hypothetical protein
MQTLITVIAILMGTGIATALLCVGFYIFCHWYQKVKDNYIDDGNR